MLEDNRIMLQSLIGNFLYLKFYSKPQYQSNMTIKYRKIRHSVFKWYPGTIHHFEGDASANKGVSQERETQNTGTNKMTPRQLRISMVVPTKILPYVSLSFQLLEV